MYSYTNVSGIYYGILICETPHRLNIACMNEYEWIRKLSWKFENHFSFKDKQPMNVSFVQRNDCNKK